MGKQVTRCGKKVTRQQRLVLERNGKDPSKYLYVSNTTVQEGKKNLDRTGIKKHLMRFINVETNQFEDFEV